MKRHLAPTFDNPLAAPTQAEWDAMTEAERAAFRVAPISATEEELDAMSSGDLHREACLMTADALSEFFSRRRGGVYVGIDLWVFYPGARRFAPDLFVAFDVEPRKRTRWVVSDEGKGPDFVLEVLHLAKPAKDLKDNVALFARLGIPEYFVYDLENRRIHGYRQADPGAEPSARRYVPILAQHGRYTSEVLGLDLLIEGDELRLYQANARLQTRAELYALLQRSLDQVNGRLGEEQRLREEEQRLRGEEQRLREEEQRLREEEQRARQDAETRLAEALALIAKLNKPANS